METPGVVRRPSCVVRRAPRAPALLAAAVLLLAAAPALAGNAFTFPIGGRAAGMAGAYTAMADEASVAWYNPAGLGFNERSSLDASATAFFLEVVKIPDFLRTTLPAADGVSAPTVRRAGYDVSSFQVVGSSLSYVYRFGPRGEAAPRLRHSLAVSVFIPQSSKFSKSVRLESPEFGYRQDLSLASEGAVYYIGPSWGMAIGDKVSVGASLFVLYATQATRAGFTVQVDDVDGGKAYGTSAVDLGVKDLGFLVALGAQYRPVPHLRLGLAVRLPGALVWRGQDGRIVTASAASGGRSLVQEAAAGGGAGLQQATPFSVSAGIAWAEEGRFAVSADVDYSTPMDAGGVRLTHLVNARVGAEVALAPRWLLSFGAFTDRAPQVPIDTSSVDAFGRTRADFYGGTVAVTFQSPYQVTGSEKTDRITFSSTFGVRYAYGSGRVAGLDIDYTEADPSRQVTASARRVVFHDLALVLGSSVRF